MSKIYSISNLNSNKFFYTTLHHFYSNFEHIHQYWEVTCQVGGESVNMVNGKVYILKAGDCIIMKPGDVHRIDSNVPNSYHRDFYVSDEKMKKILSLFNHSLYDKFSSGPVIIHLGIHTVMEIEENAMVFKIYKGLADELDDIQTSIVTYIIGKYQRESFYPYTYVPSWVSELARKLSNPDSFNLKINDICKDLNYSYGHVTREFKKYMNVSLKKYIISQRMEYAYLLLQSTNESISEISLKCGFNSVNGFINVFTKLTGISPNQYRLQQRKK